MSDSLSWVGRLFHTRGPAAANERSPRRVLVRCTIGTCPCPTNMSSAWIDDVKRSRQLHIAPQVAMIRLCVLFACLLTVCRSRYIIDPSSTWPSLPFVPSMMTSYSTCLINRIGDILCILSSYVYRSPTSWGAAICAQPLEVY